MKQTEYRVYFAEHAYKTVWACNKSEAIILAQAKRIHDGKDYLWQRVEVVERP